MDSLNYHEHEWTTVSHFGGGDIQCRSCKKFWWDVKSGKAGYPDLKVGQMSAPEALQEIERIRRAPLEHRKRWTVLAALERAANYTWDEIKTRTLEFDEIVKRETERIKYILVDDIHVKCVHEWRPRVAMNTVASAYCTRCKADAMTTGRNVIEAPGPMRECDKFAVYYKHGLAENDTPQASFMNAAREVGQPVFGAAVDWCVSYPKKSPYLAETNQPDEIEEPVSFTKSGRARSEVFKDDRPELIQLVNQLRIENSSLKMANEHLRRERGPGLKPEQPMITCDMGEYYE